MDRKPPSLPFKLQMCYAFGQMGWSILINVINLMLVYFYIPPEGAGLPYLITQVTFLGILNVVTLVAASGRLVDAITDPLIANWSDRSTHPKGRRIPFMFRAALPATLFFILLFTPPYREVSVLNIVWLVVMQIFFYVTFTFYVTPYFALIPELGHTPQERLNLATWMSIAYALGVIVAALVPIIADGLQLLEALSENRLLALQIAMGLLGIVALAGMWIPTFTIDEKKYGSGVVSNIPLMEALKTTFRNPYFRFYVVADFSYFMGLTIIMAGLLYYVTVLLKLPDSWMTPLLLVMVLFSFVFYPLVRLLAQKFGKKILMVCSFLGMSLVFLMIYFLGHFPIPAIVQAFLLILLYAIPVAFLSVLPPAILSDISEHDAVHTGESKAGMYFAARTLMQKCGQTFGILCFAALTTLGKDKGDDLGVRLSGIVGFVLCLGAGLVFRSYDEKRVLRESHEKSQELLQEAESSSATEEPNTGIREAKTGIVDKSPH